MVEEVLVMLTQDLIVFLHFLIGLLQSQVRLVLLEDMVVEVRE